MTNGMKSSEFWVALASAVIPILNSSFGWGIPMESVLGMLAYILGRSAVKAAKRDG